MERGEILPSVLPHTQGETDLVETKPLGARLFTGVHASVGVGMCACVCALLMITVLPHRDVS